MEASGSLMDKDEMYPEANRILEVLKQHLGASNISPELNSQFDNKTKQVKSLDLKLREKQAFISIFKGVLNDEENNGFTNLPEKIVQELNDRIILAEMKEQSTTNLLEQIFNLQTYITNKSNKFPLSDQNKSFILASIESKLANLVKDIPEDGVQKLKFLNDNIDKTFNCLQQECQQFEKYSKKHDSLAENVNKVKNEKFKTEDLNLQIMKLKMEIDVYKAKIADVRLAQETYGGLKGEAYKKLASQKQTELEDVKSNNEHLRNRLELYRALPKAQFEPLMQQNQKLSKEIKNAEWSRQQLEEEDDK